MDNQLEYDVMEKDVFYANLRMFESGTMTDAVRIRKLFREIIKRDVLDVLPSYYKRIAVYLIREGHIKGNVVAKAR